MLFASFLFCSPVYSQEEIIEEEITEEITEELGGEVVKDAWTSPRITDEMTVDSEQNKNWRMGQAKYSAKPKNAWELGVHFGHMFIDGDVDREIPGGYGVGLHLRKALHYIFSIRGDLFYGVAKGLEPQPWKHRWADNLGGNGVGGGLVERVFDPYNPKTNNGGPTRWFPAHKTTYIYGALQAVVNIGNILWHKERNKWNWYMAIGAGLDTHTTMLDLLDGESKPYAALVDRVQWTPTKFDTKSGRQLIKDDLKALYDGDYETEGHKKAGIFRVGDETNIHVVWTASMGVSRKISKRINIGIEHQVMVSDNDYLDGIKFRTSLDQTNNVDIPHYTNIRIGINLGNFDKRTEPLYWMNPLDATFNDMASLKSRPELDLTDEDEDGVIDMLDQELDTPEGCSVDTRGVTLDSDGDGFADCEDNEPYSPPGCPIDDYGVAQCEEPCCVDEAEIQRMIDSRTSTLKEEIKESIKTSLPAAGGYTGSTYTSGGSTGSTGSYGGSTTVVRTGCGDWFLPMIHYDLNSSTIKPEFYSHLHHVAQVMKKCPEICVVAHGHTDKRNSNNYNTALSFKRSQSAVDYMVSNYGIDRSRLKIMYGGEENPLISAPGSEAHHYMNRRVEFRTCEANDFDMAAPVGGSSSNTSSGSTINNDNFFNGNKNSGY